MERKNQATNKCLGTKFKSFYLQMEGRTKSPIGVLVEVKILLPTGERTIQATSKWLGAKFKSFYLQVEGRTKSLMNVLAEI